MHNIPSFIAIVGLILAWTNKKIRKIIGGSIFVVFFILSSIIFNSFVGNWYSLIVIGPFLLCGVLFIIDALRKEKIN